MNSLYNSKKIILLDLNDILQCFIGNFHGFFCDNNEKLGQNMLKACFNLFIKHIINLKFFSSNFLEGKALV